MSILTIEQYREDADCPELCDHDGFTIIETKDGEYNSFFDAVADKFCPLNQYDEFWDAYDATIAEVADQLGMTTADAYEWDLAYGN